MVIVAKDDATINENLEIYKTALETINLKNINDKKITIVMGGN